MNPLITCLFITIIFYSVANQASINDPSISSSEWLVGWDRLQGFLWILSGFSVSSGSSSGSSWILWDFGRSLTIPIHWLEWLRIPGDPRGSFWNPTGLILRDNPGSSRILPDPFPFAQITEDFQGFLRIFTGCFGIFWDFLGSFGIPTPATPTCHWPSPLWSVIKTQVTAQT